MNKLQKFEMSNIHDKLENIVSEYNDTKSVRRERITDLIFNRSSGYIRIRFQTYAYLIFVYKGGYHLAWFHQDKDNKEIFIQDGVRIFTDTNKLWDEVNTFIWSCFNPVRGEWWQLQPRPTKSPRKGNWDRF